MCPGCRKPHHVGHDPALRWEAVLDKCYVCERIAAEKAAMNEAEGASLDGLYISMQQRSAPERQ